jgi:predicted HTH transcriptional regulator
LHESCGYASKGDNSRNSYRISHTQAQGKSKSVIDRLLRERLIDEADGSYAIRRLGALLLSKRLTDFQDLERKAARVVVYTGTSKLETRLDQVGGKGYATGCRERMPEFG